MEQFANRTIVDCAYEWVLREPQSVVFHDDTSPLTYSSLVLDAEALAASLVQLGLQAGDVVSLQIPNWSEAAVINLACAMTGLVINPIVPIYRDAEVGMMLADANARVLFTAATFANYDYAGMVERLRPQLPSLMQVVFVRGGAQTAGSGPDFRTFIDSGRGVKNVQDHVDPDSVKMILYTSGTTGRPKAVLHSHNTLGRVSASCIKFWGVQSGDTLLMPSPVTHISGFVFGLEFPLFGGTRTVLMEKWDAASAVDLIQRYGVVGTVAATPFLRELTVRAMEMDTRLPSLRFFGCGGAAVPPENIYDANTFFGRPVAFRVFGSSEVPMVTLGFPGNEELSAITDGKIVDYDVRVIDDQGEDVAMECEGEILARGPSMFLGYADDGQTEAALTEDGYFRTGDIGRRTRDGGLVITGRKKDLIIRGGENISAKEIEDILHRHPEINEVAVVAMPHPRLGEGICAFVIPKDGCTPDLETIKRFVLDAGLAKQKQPEHLEIVDEFPRTASGKIRKDLLREKISALLGVKGRF